MAALVGLLAGVVREVISEKRTWGTSACFFLKYPPMARKTGSRAQGQLGDVPLFVARLLRWGTSSW